MYRHLLHGPAMSSCLPTTIRTGENRETRQSENSAASGGPDLSNMSMTDKLSTIKTEYQQVGMGTYAVQLAILSKPLEIRFGLPIPSWLDQFLFPRRILLAGLDIG